MTDIQELLARSRALLKDSPKKASRKKTATPLEPYTPSPVQKYVHSKVFQVLAPVGFEFANNIVSMYYNEGIYALKSDAPHWTNFTDDTIIIHGEHRGERCGGIVHQCHVIGFRPVGMPPEWMAYWERFGYDV